MTKPVPNFGPSDAKIMVIGEAPGADEVREGRPFIGYSGTLLRDVLASAGIDPEQVFYSNICQQRPPGNELRAFFSDSGQPNSAIVEGLTALKADIERVNPNLIIPVGNYPLRYATNKGHWTKQGWTGIGSYRGSLLQGSAFVGGRKCLPTYHPAAAVRQLLFKHIMRADLTRAAREANTAEISRPRFHIAIDPRGADRNAWAAWLVSPEGSESPPFLWHRESPDGLTTEVLANDGLATVRSSGFLTADIEYIGSKLLCVGATRHPDVAVVFRTQDSGDVDLVRGVLLSGVPLCFQNAMFDCSILEWFYDTPCLQFLQHDTMIAMHAAYVEMPKDLGFIGSLFTEWPVWWEAIDWKKIRDGSTPIEAILPYNGKDVMVCHSAMKAMLGDELLDKDVARTYRHEMNLVKPLWDISRRGVRIDIASLESLSKTLTTEATTLSAGIAHYNGGKPVNVKSPPQVAEFLYGAMKVPRVGPKTPGGRWKMDDTTLSDLLLKSPLERQRSAIKMIRDARERLDLVSKFCEIELDDDGRMRCHYDPAKTDTGRLSSRKFYPTGRGTNLQNVPRDDRVRSVFVPDPGYVFGYADLKSAESFVVAHITGDPEMLRLHTPDFLSGGLDGHRYVASFLLEKPIEQITGDERYLGKRVRHAGNYGLSWLRLQQLINADAQKTGVSIDAKRAKQLIAKYRQLHPFLEVWWRDIQAELWKTHTLYTCHRRKRVFYGRPDQILPEAIAFNPQGTVADTLNLGLLRVAANEQLQLLDFQMLLQVHDAIGFQVPEANLEAVLPVLQQAMFIPVPIRRRGLEPYEIIIPVDIKVGLNWGEFHEKRNPNGLKHAA